MHFPDEQGQEDHATLPAGEADFTWTKAHTLILVILGLAQLIELVDITVVNVALAAVQRDLHFSGDSLSWVINSYTVLFGGFLLLGGRAGDLLGKRRVFLAGVAAFTIASLASGLAPNAGTLIGTRALQGLSAAFIAPMTLAMISASFPEGKPRNRAMAIWGAIAGVSGSLGVTLGGLLSSGPGWRWIFFVNIPAGIFILAVTPLCLKADTPGRRNRSFDTVGAVTVTAGVGLLAYAVSETSTYAWSSGRTIGLLAASGVLLAFFVIQETQIAAQPLVPFRIFANRSVTGGNLVAFLVGGAMLAMFYFVSLYLQQILHYSPVKTGLLYLPLTGALMVVSGVTPLLIPRLGIRYVLMLGGLLAGAGMLMFSRMTPGGGLWVNVFVPSLIVGPGLALNFIPMTIAGVAGVPPNQAGLASGMVNVTRTIGSALGLAVIVSIAAADTSHHLKTGFVASTALSDGFRLGFLICAGVMAVSAASAVALFRSEGRGQPVDLTALAAADSGG